MDLYILIALVLLFALLWFVVRPWWQSRSASVPAPDKPKTTSKKKPAKIGSIYQGLGGSFKFRSDTREWGKQFKQWVADAASPKRAALSNTLPAQMENFAARSSELTAAELEQFTAQVARYCAAVNFDLGWLNNAQVSREPELKQAVEDAVLLSALSAWRADRVQQDVRVFLTYHAWRAKPNQHKGFGQELHQVMIERGLVTIPAELYLAPEKERLAQARTAICQVADKNPAAFRSVLRQLAGVPESPAPVSAAAT
jgi:hypothetical protein